MLSLNFCNHVIHVKKLNLVGKSRASYFNTLDYFKCDMFRLLNNLKTLCRDKFIGRNYLPFL